MPTERHFSAGRTAVLAVALTASLGLAGCEVNRATGERTATGAAIGAGAGAAAGLLTGDFLGKTVTGAAAGAAGGFVYDQVKKR